MLHVDLILPSVHAGHPTSRDAVVFGTTADYVARNAPCWVWTVRRGLAVRNNRSQPATEEADQ